MDYQNWSRLLLEKTVFIFVITPDKRMDFVKLQIADNCKQSRLDHIPFSIIRRWPLPHSIILNPSYLENILSITHLSALFKVWKEYIWIIIIIIIITDFPSLEQIVMESYAFENCNEVYIESRTIQLINWLANRVQIRV